MRPTLVTALAIGAFVMHAAVAQAASITRSPADGPPGTLVTVSGSGFRAHSTVKVTLSTSAKSTTVRSDGTFSLKLSVPRTAGGTHTVQATAGSTKATKPFTVTQRVTATPLNVVPRDPLCTTLGMPTHSTVTVTAVGYGASSTLEVTYGGEYVKKVVSDSSGTSSFTFTVKNRPNDIYNLKVTDLKHTGFQASKSLASSDHSCWTAAQKGSSTLNWQWDGVGWDADTGVSLYYMQGSTRVTVASTTTASNGAFGLITRQTACPPPGVYQVSMSAVVQGHPVTVSLGSLNGC